MSTLKRIKIILWLQLMFGLGGAFIAFSYMHWGAMSAAWGYNLRLELEKQQQAAGYQAPPPIRDQSLQKIVGDLEAYGHARADVAFYWLLTSIALAVFSVLVFCCLLEPSNRKVEQT